MEDKVSGGATLWARQTVDSEIFYDKPDKWFKIWFYIVNRVNHKEHRKWKRGECHILYKEIMDATKATKNQVEKCVKYLKNAQMLATQKATRGMHVKVLKYNKYQSIVTYENEPEIARRKHLLFLRVQVLGHYLNQII